MAEDRSPLRSIRAVLFDAVGTLIYGDPGVIDVYFRLGATHGSRLPVEVVGRRFLAALDAFHPRPAGGDVPLVTSQEKEYQRWQAIVADVFTDLPDTLPLFNELWIHFAQPESWRVYEDVQSTLEKLSEEGLQCSVASNFDERLDGIARHIFPTTQVRHVFHSAGLGVRKPSVGFFRRIEHAISLAPHQLMLVGDSHEMDYQAAKQAGWNAIWLRRGEAELDSDQVSDLRQLADLIAAC